LREGGEKLRLRHGGATRSLKNLLQEARMPPWERERLPLIYCADTLAAVPGLGVACSFQAAAGAAGWTVTWQAQEWTRADAVASEARDAELWRAGSRPDSCGAGDTKQNP
jgi:tRNA(Ile)-lysidine synthetase-like protein